MLMKDDLCICKCEKEKRLNDMFCRKNSCNTPSSTLSLFEVKVRLI